jgi:signal peptide peptidase SppA, 36K type
MWNSKKSQINPNDPNRDWLLLEDLLRDTYSEQKKSRRWGVVFKTLTFIYLFILLATFFFGARSGGVQVPYAKSHVAVVRLDGVIAADESASAGKVGEALRNAFKNDHAKAVILAINSPGGSPVQSGYIYDEMLRLKSLHQDKKLYAVIADIGASGGYYVAAAADEIYADKASLVGSIGVTASSFGFVEAMNKLGVERRHFTAGEHKAFLDPFSPVKEDEKLFWQEVLQKTHEQFINAVKTGRGDRLELTEEVTSGLIWNGEQALALGLVDGLGGVRYVAREIVGEENLRDYTIKDSPLKMLLQDLGVSIGKGMALAIKGDAVPEIR